MSLAPVESCSGHEHRPAAELHARLLDPVASARAAAIFRALGEPARLRLLALMLAGEMCVSEIATAVDDSLPAVSQRLKLLKSERIVISRRAGKHVYYSLADQHIRDLISNALAHAAES